MESTHTFKLVSGVECEVEMLRGEHQRMLTQDKNLLTGKGINLMIESLLVRIGSKTAITSTDVDNLLSADRKKILKEARMFALNYEPKFDFTYEWESDNNKVFKSEHSVEFDDTDFKETPYSVINDKGELVPLNVTEYADINKLVKVTLPISKKMVQFKMLDGAAEVASGNILKKDRSSHTPITMRNPNYVEVKNKKEKLIMVTSTDLDRMPLMDIEHLRGMIKKVEGEIETLLVIDHPKKDEQATIEIVGTPAFFFPSEANL